MFFGGFVHDHGFADLMTRLGRPELIVDPRFKDDVGRSAHHREFVQELVDAMASRTLAEWCDDPTDGRRGGTPTSSAFSVK